MRNRPVPKRLRGRSAKPPFVGSSPTRALSAFAREWANENIDEIKHILKQKEAIWLAAGKPNPHHATWMYWKAMERVHDLEALLQLAHDALRRIENSSDEDTPQFIARQALSTLPLAMIPDKKVQIAGSIATDSKMAPNRPVSHHVKTCKVCQSKVKRRRKTDAKPPHI